jgi:CDP-diacylglycerol--glycerol-3-phosphate 3-phosphatidyltransferase
MLDKYARASWTRIMSPVARALLRAGIGPDTVTVVGTLGVCAGALIFYPQGEFLVGTLVITAFVFADNVDGIMARMSGRTSPWGSFLDSVLDRFADAAIFAGLAMWFAGPGDDLRMTALLIACLVLGGVVSYVRAKAESLGYEARGGVAERAERLLAILLTTGLVGWFDLPLLILEVVLWLLVAASAWTIIVRIRHVRQQVVAA